MKRINYKIISIVLAFSFLIFSSNVYAAPNLVGGITINNGAEKTTKQDVDLTITAGEPTSTSKLETSQADFSQGTLTKVVTSGDNIKLDKFIDGGFESGNFDTWDRSDGFQIVTSPVASGKYAAKGVGISDGRSNLTKKFDTPQANVYFRAKVMFGEFAPQHYTFCPFTNRGCFYALYTDSNHFVYFNGRDHLYFPIDTTYQANTWYNIEVYFWGDDVNIYHVLINGVDITNGGLPAKDDGGNVIKSLNDIRIFSGDSWGNGTTIIDDVFITTNIKSIFKDGFESGELSRWDTACDAIEFITGKVYSGQKAIKFLDRRTYSLVKNFNNIKNGYCRYNVMIKGATHDQVLFGSNGEWGKTTWGHGVVARSDGHFGNNSGYFPTDMTYLPDTWYTIEVYWYGDTSKYKVLIDGNDLTQGGIDFKDNAGNLFKGTYAFMLRDIGQDTIIDSLFILDLDMDEFPNSTTNIPTYSFSGTRTSPAIDLTDVDTAISSKVDWNADTPKDTLVSVDVSLDGGTTWQTVTKGGEIPGIISGTNLKGKKLLVRQRLSTTNMEVTPQLQDIVVTINGVKPATGSVKMMLSNDSEFKDASWQTYVTSKKWTLTDGDGTKSVYVKFKNVLGESETFSDEILMQLEVSLNEIYDAIKKINPKSPVRVIKDKEFTELSYCQVEGKDKDNIVTATLVSVPSSEYKFSILTGKFTSAGAKALIIGNELFLFYVIEPPSIEDIVTITFN